MDISKTKSSILVFFQKLYYTDKGDNVKKYVIFIVCLFCFLPIVHALDISSKNAILYNLDENVILYEKYSEEKISIASLTKIMTAIVALENIENLDEQIILTKDDFYGLEEAGASVAGFQVGQKVTYRDLLYGLLLPSGADAAQALTRLIFQNRNTFIEQMNEKAKQLKLENTHFENETGLDEENHYSTVKDVAQIFQYALKNEDFYSIITSSSYTMSDGSFTVYSTIDKNKRRYGIDMDYILGGKTGTTYDAGLCLASIASKNGVNYLLVTAKAPYNEGPKNLYDAKTIYEYFMSHFENKTILEQNDVLVTLDTEYAKEKNIVFRSKETFQKYLPIDVNKENLRYQYEGMKVISYKTKVGTKLGTLTISQQDDILKTIDILLEEPLTFSLWNYIVVHKKIVFLTFCFLLIILGIILKKK